MPVAKARHPQYNGPTGVRLENSDLSLHVLLVNPNRMQPPIGPIGLDYLGDALRAAGHDVKVLDLCFAADYGAAIGDHFRHKRPDLIGFSIRNTDDCYFASQESFLGLYRDVLAQLRAHSTAPIVLGGVGFSVMPEAILRRCGAECGVAGDGEAAIVAIADRIVRGESWCDVPGLVYRAGDGFRRNPPRFAALDVFPRPRSTVDNRRYLAEGGMGNVETKRGCGQRCIYCADPLSKGRRYRLRSPQAVADELEALLAQGVSWLHLCDAEFNLPRAHAEAVCAEIIARGLGERLRWYTYAAAQPFDGRLAALMRRAGCRGINFGVDSGSDAVLRRLGRPYCAADLRRTAAACRREGLTFMYDLLIGGPGETKETLRATIDPMKEVEPDRVGAAVGVRIYTGTLLAAQVAAAGFHPGNPELHGAIAGNEDYAEPVFFLSAALGPDAVDHVRELVAGDQRFFVGAKKGELARNYNYNDNSVLVEAIRRGHRGAYWDILRQIGV